MAKNKIMILNGKEEKDLHEKGSVLVKRKGFFYRVTKVGENDFVITSENDTINVVCPLDLPSGSIIITHDENRELRETGKTTHVKGGVLYTITRDEQGATHCEVACEYSGQVIFSSDC